MFAQNTPALGAGAMPWPEKANGGVGTMSAEQLDRKDVNVRLQYLKDDPIYQTEKPIQITPNFLDKEGRSNVRLAPGAVETIRDIRGSEHNFSLDTNGFRYVQAPTMFTQWSSQPDIGRRYLPELEEILRREVDGCDEIMFYDARIRQEGDEGLRVEGLSYNPFARQVHTDNTEKSVVAKIRALTDMKADYLLHGRARIINIWRPIKHAVYDCGLAIADGGKLRDGDVMECDRHRQDTGEYWDTMGVIKYREGFNWWYMSRQAPDEVLLFKNYDSATNVQARCCLHTAFDLPPEAVPANAPTRESIEVRALIFTYPADGQRPSGGLKMQHPLAKSLEQGQLKCMDVEHSMIDQLLRTEIDEGSEIKDAFLLLRRNEIIRLQIVQKDLEAERDNLQTQLKVVGEKLHDMEQQASIERKHAESLQAQVQCMSRQLSQNRPELRSKIRALSAELINTRFTVEQVHVGDGGPVNNNRSPSYRSGDTQSCRLDERSILVNQLKAAQEEAAMWKQEAFGKGNKAVSDVWKAAVEEGIRREREKDAWVIQNLEAQIKKLMSSSK